MAPRRLFLPITVAAEAGRRRIHRIICSCCGFADDVSANTIGGARATEDLMNVWRRRGWEVGRAPSSDKCPVCITGERRRLTPANTPYATVEKAPMTVDKGTSENVVAMPVAAAPPRVMGREDRRLVFARLHEVYLDERRGYENGWTDARVAEDLGVPRAWVTEVRDENFGPIRDNEEVRAATAQMDAIAAEALALLERSRRLLDGADELRCDLDRIATALAEGKAVVDKLRKAVGR